MSTIFVLTIILSFVISSIIYSQPTYRYYKLLYSRIPYLYLYVTYDFDSWLEDPDLDLLVFNDNTARFNSYYYLRYTYFNWFDPYSLYWRIKIIKSLTKQRIKLKLK